MKLQGTAYSASRIKGLAGAMDDLANGLLDMRGRYETNRAAARTALGDDDYARGYWQTHGPRLEAIGIGLGLLYEAVQREEGRLGHASSIYKAADDANDASH
ncbi:hypothetical protein [Nonomuraea sp. NPDC050691]|uniref:hypothetical protein n=1 Tax=Nonomuraea sp. NPDC050691 TaxID=3155661 RepID=UPI00340BD82B